MRETLLLFSVVLFLCSCTGGGSSKAQEIVDKAIKAHGGQHLSNTRVSFSFRDIEYAVSRNPAAYTYTRSFKDSVGRVKDVLINSSEFTRTVNGDTVPLTDEWKEKYSNSVNSVLYFMQLPYLLNDEAVNKSYIGTTTIADEPYHVIKITFDAQSGGNDYEDEFMYWIHQETFTVDYLAYSYETDGGGARFREAFNRRERGGILFQDYINYKVEKGTPLKEIPKLFEAGKLKELSRIENKNIQVKRTNK